MAAVAVCLLRRRFRRAMRYAASVAIIYVSTYVRPVASGELFAPPFTEHAAIAALYRQNPSEFHVAAPRGAQAPSEFHIDAPHGAPSAHREVVRETLLAIGLAAADPLELQQRDFAVAREVGVLAMDPEFGPRTSSMRASGARRSSRSRPRASSPPSA